MTGSPLKKNSFSRPMKVSVGHAVLGKLGHPAEHLVVCDDLHGGLRRARRVDDLPARCRAQRLGQAFVAADMVWRQRSYSARIEPACSRLRASSLSERILSVRVPDLLSTRSAPDGPTCATTLPPPPASK